MSLRPIHTPMRRRGAGWVVHRLVAVLWLLPAAATSAQPVTPPARLTLQHIGIVQGLAQSAAQAIAQDRRGYMWLGTQSGLQRYDGYVFINYHHDPARLASLAQNDVSALATAADGSVWVATRSAGVDVMRPGRDGFDHYVHRPGDPGSLASNTVYSLLVDRDQRLWAGTQAGLDRLLPDGRFRYYPVPTRAINGNRVLALLQTRDGDIWVGTSSGAYRYDAAGDRLKPLPVTADFPPVAREALAGTVNALARMPDGDLWVGTEQGIVVVSAAGGFVHLYRHDPADPASLGSDRVRAIARDRTGDTWVATYGGGLSRKRDGGHGFVTYRHDAGDQASLSRDNLYTLFVDQTGLLWIGSQGGGIDIYNPASRAFESLRHDRSQGSTDVDDLVWAIGPDANGRLWAGTHAGLSRVDTADARLDHQPLAGAPQGLADGEPIMALHGDGAGGLWLGTTIGLFHRSADGASVAAVDLQAPGGNPDALRVSQLFVDADGRLWVGTHWGLLQLDPASGRVLRRFAQVPGGPGALPRPGISAICQSTDGALWIGSEHGLRRFDGVHDRFRVPASRPGLHDVLAVSDILSCLADPDGSLWVGTASGIVHFRPGVGVLHSYAESDGLPSQTIYGLLRDTGGAIWAGTDRGLLRLDPATGRVRSYGQPDGLENEEFNQGAAYAGADGTLYFGGVNGITAVHPSQLAARRLAPRVGIGSYTLIGRDGEHTSTFVPAGLTLTYRQAILTLSVAVLDFGDPRDNFFRYRLLGFDDTWHTLRSRHTITFTNLNAGDYRLQVAGGGSDGTLSPHQAQLAIHVLPPPWRSWWAYLIYACVALAIVAAGLTLFALWIRRRRDFISEQQRRRWAEALHDLMHGISRLQDEHEIAAQLLQRLPQLVAFDRVAFFGDGDDGLRLLDQRGFDAHAEARLRLWPGDHAEHVERLRGQGARDPLLAMETGQYGELSSAMAQVLELPFVAGEDRMYLLLVGRRSPPFDAAEQDICDILVRQLAVVLERARLIRRLAVLATTDSLTHTLNRRSFLEHAQAEFARARRYQGGFAVLLLDLDHFKSINDTHGHQVGDEVLRALVEQCTPHLRDSDFMGRYGGEEFVVCLPQADAAEASTVAERLRGDVAQIRVPSARGTVSVTVSIGVAVLDRGDADLAALLARADAALYLAKHRGRNRVEQAVRPTSGPEGGDTGV